MKRVVKYSVLALLVSLIGGMTQISCDSPEGDKKERVHSERDKTAGSTSEENIAIPEKEGITTKARKVKFTGKQPETGQNSGEELAEDSQEYADEWGAERDELKSSLKEEIEAIETKIDEMKDSINGAGPDIRTRYQRAIAELKVERSKLNDQLKKLNLAKRDNWEKVKNKVNTAVQAADERISQVAIKVAR